MSESNPSSNLEDLLLEQAIREGLLSRARLQAVEKALVERPDMITSLWGPRIGLLLKSGELGQATLENLVQRILPEGSASLRFSEGQTDFKATPEGMRAQSLEAGESIYPPSGPSLGRYQGLTMVGAGGAGRVFRAFDPQLRRTVALKLLHGKAEGDLGPILREARAQARVEHPNVCKVYEVGEIEGQPYIAMQFIAGMTLDQAAPMLGLEEKVRLLAEACDGVHAAHRLGLVHLDLKPGNILLETLEDGSYRPYVTDFGLMVREGIGKGGPRGWTPGFSSPEQAAGLFGKLDRRSDVYSLGATLNVLLSGSSPRPMQPGEDSMSQRLKAGTHPPSQRLTEVPSDLAAIVHKCLSEAPGERYDSARALAQDLRRFLDGAPVQAHGSSLGYRARKWVARHLALSAVAGVSMLLVSGFGAWGLRTSLRARTQASLAQRFGMESKELELYLRMAYLLPAHDVRVEEGQVRDRMEAMKHEIKSLGRVAEGPGRLALGRCLMALGREEEAKEELDAAWASGYHLPEVASSLGVCYLTLYQLGVKDLSAKARMERRRELEPSLIAPARSFLQIGAGESPAEAAYAQGLLAFAEGRLSEAATLARQARERLPWFVEAWKLEADTHMQGARHLNEAGKRDGALSELDEAGKILDAARKVNRSSGHLLQGEVERSILLLQVKIGSGSAQEADLARILAAVEGMLYVEPGNWIALAYRSEAHRYWGTFLDGQSKDSSAQFNWAEEFAEQVVARNSKAWRCWADLGVIARVRAEKEQAHGSDPRPYLQIAIRALRRALEAPNGQSRQWGNLGTCYGTSAAYELAHGMDPRPSLEQAVESQMKGLEKSQILPDFYIDIGFARVEEAQYLMWKGAEPWQAFDLAEKALKAALALNPDEPIALGNLAELYSLWGQALHEHEKDPSALLDKAVAIAQRYQTLHPEQSTSHIVLGEVWGRRGDYLASTGRDAAPAFVEGERALERAIHMNPLDGEALRVSGELLKERFRWELSLGRPQGSTYSRGLSRLEAALKANPEDAEVLVWKGELLFLGANAFHKAALRHQGEEALTAAVRINGNLAALADRAKRSGTQD